MAVAEHAAGHRDVMVTVVEYVDLARDCLIDVIESRRNQEQARQEIKELGVDKEEGGWMHSELTQRQRELFDSISIDIWEWRGG
jgi:hypothetical protein